MFGHSWENLSCLRVTAARGCGVAVPKFQFFLTIKKSRILFIFAPTFGKLSTRPREKKTVEITRNKKSRASSKGWALKGLRADVKGTG